MSHSIVGIIPARYASTRFPGKMLTSIAGTTLLQRTYMRAIQCDELDQVIIATDDQRIADHAIQFGAEVVMTPPDCETGTDRIAEVIIGDPKRFATTQIVVNIQGDEPLIEQNTISSLIRALQHGEAPMATAITPLIDRQELNNPSVVKCVTDLYGRALYFSRSAIPSAGNQHYRHLGIYAFRTPFLLTYRTLTPTPIQQTEKLEQLKALEHGYSIQTVVVEEQGVGVDTPDDVKRIEEILCNRNTSSLPVESAAL